ncbi:DUF2066 domain-containing protein [Wenzhouxiangella sp. XN24]|uniref:DUF2066 domain-containing protein n=1 Tax=Wenzhouxiangella sp. XN24 TaxID=2713569 RepID=UPI0013EBAD5D|nr:DUF2066 domain-containing protein [Wenzhouxiangella sp. XN24]
MLIQRIRPALWLALATAFVLGFGHPAGAASVAGLYEAEAAFEGEREAGFRAALAQVLVRVTGRRDVVDRPAVEPLLDDAAAYVQQFRQPGPGRLWAAFDGVAVERELARLGLPVWGVERPGTLLWIAVDAGGGERFVVASGDEVPAESAIRQQVLDAAARRGIPVVFPLMDAEDRSRASFAEVWGGFEDSIRDASARYGVDAVLVGRLSADDLGYGRWTFYGADGVARWSGDVGASIDRLADRFAARFAVVTTGAAREVRLAVSGVETIADYGRVSRFLGSLTAVERVGVERVEQDRIVYRIELRGGADALGEAVRLDGLLRADDTAGPEYELNYRVAR